MHSVGNLNFHEPQGPDQSKAVDVLQKDDQLRQGIITHVFEKLTDRNELSETELHKFESSSHSGLSFRKSDHKFVVNLAFETDNSNLWANFIIN